MWVHYQKCTQVYSWILFLVKWLIHGRNYTCQFTCLTKLGLYSIIVYSISQYSVTFTLIIIAIRIVINHGLCYTDVFQHSGCVRVSLQSAICWTFRNKCSTDAHRKLFSSCFPVLLFTCLVFYISVSYIKQQVWKRQSYSFGWEHTWMVGWHRGEHLKAKHH